MKNRSVTEERERDANLIHSVAIQSSLYSSIRVTPNNMP